MQFILLSVKDASADVTCPSLAQKLQQQQMQSQEDAQWLQREEENLTVSNYNSISLFVHYLLSRVVSWEFSRDVIMGNKPLSRSGSRYESVSEAHLERQVKCVKTRLVSSELVSQCACCARS